MSIVSMRAHLKILLEITPNQHQVFCSRPSIQPICESAWRKPKVTLRGRSIAVLASFIDNDYLLFLLFFLRCTGWGVNYFFIECPMLT